MTFSAALGTIAFAYLAYVLPLLLVVGLVVHLGFPRAVRDDLFNDRFFSPYELRTFDSFPMSLLLTLSFVRGVVAPETIRRRFGGYDFVAQIPSWFRILCFAYAAMLISGGAIGVLMAGYGVFITFFAS